MIFICVANISREKTTIIIQFSSGIASINPIISSLVGNWLVEHVEVVSFLGISIERKLTWTKQVDQVCLQGRFIVSAMISPHQLVFFLERGF